MSTFGTEDRPTSEDDWFVGAFGPLYPIIYAHRNEEAAAREAAFAAHALQLSREDAALDLCCGAGRHLAVLSDYTPSLAGVDYSPELLARIPEAVRRSVALVRADMRALPFEAAFDAVFCFFTSFGYFLDEEENRAAAAAMARSLLPGARFFMDYLNPPRVAEQLEPETDRFSGDYRIHERRWIDSRLRRVNKETSVWLNGRHLGDTRESVRLYEPAELEELLQSAGLEIMQQYGDYAGNAYTARTPRMLLTGTRIR